MSLRWRLVLLFSLLTLLPALAASLVTRDLLERSVALSLSDEIDAALEAGVRQSRTGLDVERDRLREEAGRWRATFESGADPAGVDASAFDPAVRVTWPRRGLVLVQGDPALRAPDAPPERGRPPHRLVERVALGAEDELVLERLVDPGWRTDAMATADALQIVRSLRAQRSELERGFTMPFVLIYAVTLVVALLAALLLARSWTRRVDRLVTAIDAVGSGDWTAQSGVRGRDELGLLGAGFDRMVTTLDAQSRHLVELETMAGWREMARALAHEIKNPLTPIQLTVEEMRERYRGDDPQYRALLDECARIVIEEVESLRTVVSRFREFARPSELQRAPTDVNALLRDLGALQKDLVVDYDLAPDLPAVHADADRLRQVLMNLASNAREATQGRAGARLGLGSRRVPDGVALVFEDDGPGIAPDQRERVFEPYRTGKKSGLGLGLALVKGIVLAHDGTITIDEGRWGGARFTIVLPAVGSTEEKAA